MRAVSKGTLDPALAGMTFATVLVGVGPKEGSCSESPSGGGGRRRVEGVVLVINVSVPAYGMGRVSVTLMEGKEKEKDLHGKPLQ